MRWWRPRGPVGLIFERHSGVSIAVVISIGSHWDVHSHSTQQIGAHSTPTHTHSQIEYSIWNTLRVVSTRVIFHSYSFKNKLEINTGEYWRSNLDFESTVQLSLTYLICKIEKPLEATQCNVEYCSCNVLAMYSTVYCQYSTVATTHESIARTVQ